MGEATTGSPPFFIVACDRSGTTMLRLILDRHSQVAIPPESFFIADFYCRLTAYGDLQVPTRRLKLVKDVLSHSRVRIWKLELDANDLCERIAGQRCYANLVSAVFEAYARKSGKWRWGDKTVYYVHWIEELKLLFPEARFVHLVRDGRDVALSLLQRPFGPANIYAAARYWQTAVLAGSRAAENDERVLQLRYEDLVSDPERYVQQICGFLDLEFEPSMLEIESTGAEKFLPNQIDWFRRVFDGISTASVGKWPIQMSPWQKSVFQDVAGAELARFGYELSPDVPPVRWRGMVYKLLAAHNFLAKIVQWFRLHVITERCREVPELLRRRFHDLLWKRKR